MQTVHGMAIKNVLNLLFRYPNIKQLIAENEAENKKKNRLVP